MPRPEDRRRIAAAGRARFDQEYDEFVATLEPDTYPVDDFIDDFLGYFDRLLNAETRAEVRAELDRIEVVVDEEITIE